MRLGLAFAIVSLVLPHPGLPAQRTTPAHQIGLDAAHALAFSLSYTHRVGQSNFGIGGRLGFAWELNTHTFDANVWEAKHMEGFVRYNFSQVLQIDAGVSVMGYLWADDCSECKGSFVGLYSAAMFGYRFVFVGVSARLGGKSDRFYGEEFGVIVSPQVRIVIPLGS